MKTLLIIICALTGILSHHSYADCNGRLSGFAPCFELLENIRRDDYITELKKLAAKGEANANFELGMLYELSESSKEDKQKSHSYYLQAAKLGHATASYLVGVNLLDGYGADQSIEDALNWFLQAAESGHDKSMYNAASIIIHYGKTNLYKESIKYLLEAESKGNTNTYYLLYKSYLEGIGVDISIGKAIGYLELGYQAGDSDSITQLAYLYLVGRGVEKNEVKGWELMREAARLGNNVAYEVIKLYEGSDE